MSGYDPLEMRQMEIDYQYHLDPQYSRGTTRQFAGAQAGTPKTGSKYGTNFYAVTLSGSTHVAYPGSKSNAGK
jgi:hypothetical protein